ncbi:response regulator transcription factor [Chloroflexota bacterium]
MQNKPKVLVIDDEDRNLRLIEAMLIPEGYDVVFAHNGKEGLEKIKEACPNVILLDIIMPGMNGYEVLSVIRQRSNVPVIMVTAVKEATSANKALSLGADDYIRKPFRKQELLARLRTKLRRANSK